MSFASKEKSQLRFTKLKITHNIILCFVYIVLTFEDSLQMLVSQTTYMEEGFES